MPWVSGVVAVDVEGSDSWLASAVKVGREQPGLGPDTISTTTADN
jgi:hypothetical protein